MTKSYEDVYTSGRGSYSLNLMHIGYREIAILKSKDCCHFMHKGNRDCDFYLSDDCISYYSPSKGSFVFNFKTKEIVN